MPDVQLEAELIRTRAGLARSFNPSGPVGDVELFAGRITQIGRILSAVSQPGQHVVLYGERGVGKTSLAGLTHEFWNESFKDSDSVRAVRYNCSPADNFRSVWSHIAQAIYDEYEKRGEDHPPGNAWSELFGQLLNLEADANSVKRFLDLTGKTFIVVIDEFDQIQDERTNSEFASTIKALSDHLVDTTLILVGVADTVDDLMRDHASIDRPLIQVPLPPMSTLELAEIINRGYRRAGITAEPAVVDLMAKLAQGLPHYAHRFGQEAGLAAVHRGSLAVEREDVEFAVGLGIELTNETIRFAYTKAMTSPQKHTLFDKVLLACALAAPDDLGFFAPADIREPLAKATGKRYEIPQFVGHLKKFCTAEKGGVLGAMAKPGSAGTGFIIRSCGHMSC